MSLSIEYKVMTMEKAFERYMNEVRTTQRLSELQEKELCERIKKGEAAAVEALVKANLKLVVATADSFSRKGMELEDMVSEGNIALMKAAIKYDAEKGRFAAYALPIIRQAIEQAIEKQSALCGEPRIADAKGGRKPVHKTLSVDAPLNGRQKTVTLLNYLFDADAPDADALLLDNVVSQRIERAMAVLSDREKEVMRHCFGMGTEKKTFAEIGDEMGLKRERVRQIRNKALRKMRGPLKETR